MRPPDAPSPQDFESIDTTVVVPEGGFPVASLDWVVPPAPTKRPSVSNGVIAVETKTEQAPVKLKL